VAPPYAYVPPDVNGTEKKTQPGPTSFTAAGGDYMKRTQYATLNDDIQSRLNDN